MRSSKNLYFLAVIFIGLVIFAYFNFSPTGFVTAKSDPFGSIVNFFSGFFEEPQKAKTPMVFGARYIKQSTCGNGNCDFFESSQSCPSDCSEIKNVDLDVTFIERTPKYPRYRVTYFADRTLCLPENPDFYPYSEDRGPQLCPGESSKKRWPEQGEHVTFTAHFKKNGLDPIGDISFAWFIDGVLLKSGVHSSLSSDQEGTETIEWVWPANFEDHKIKFVIDSSNSIAEIHEKNNLIEDYTNGLSIGMFISPLAYSKLREGTSSPEDWIQNHFARLNAMFIDAGVKERVRVDKLFVAEPFTSGPDFLWIRKVVDSDPDRWNEDGWWGVADDYRSYSGFYDASSDIDYGMLHELIHQFGIIDVYNMNSDDQYDKLLDKKLNRQGAGCGIEYGWQNNWDCYSLSFSHPEIGKDLANDVSHNIGLHTAKALNSNVHKRRGYFGEYLFDVPSTILIKFVDNSGTPISGAQVNIFQPEPDRIISASVLRKTLITDSNGIISLDPISGVYTQSTQTETGHRLNANPFGNINVVGTNGLMLFEISKNEKYDYKWLPLVLPNIAYWNGETNQASFTISTSFS